MTLALTFTLPVPLSTKNREYAETLGTSVGNRLRESQSPSADFPTMVHAQIMGNVKNGMMYRQPESVQDSVFEAAYEIAMQIINQPRPVVAEPEVDEPDLYTDTDY